MAALFPKADSDDFVAVAHCSTPTEAHLIKGVLESAALSPVTTDSHLLQAYDWLTPAVGGVRVLVPASEVDAAQQALDAYRAGELALAGEDAVQKPPQQTLAAPIYSPDIAALLSFFLVSPAFGAGIHLLNSRTLRPQGAGALAWLWLLVLAGTSLVTMFSLAMGAAAPVNPAFAALAASLLTAVWYLSFGQAHSKAVIQTYGTAYPRLSLAPIAITVFLLQVGLMWWLSERLG
ncbi:hypothetical protein [Roseateles sp. P5_E7]